MKNLAKTNCLISPNSLKHFNSSPSSQLLSSMKSSPLSSKAGLPDFNHFSTLSNSPKPDNISSTKKRSSCSPKTELTSVQDAFNYLILRDIGCSKKNAIALTSRNTYSKKHLVSVLPPHFRYKFKQNFEKSKYKPYEFDKDDWAFQRISKAYNRIIGKNDYDFERSKKMFEEKNDNLLKKIKSGSIYTKPIASNEDSRIFPQGNLKSFSKNSCERLEIPNNSPTVSSTSRVSFENMTQDSTEKSAYDTNRIRIPSYSKAHQISINENPESFDESDKEKLKVKNNMEKDEKVQKNKGKKTKKLMIKQSVVIKRHCQRNEL